MNTIEKNSLIWVIDWTDTAGPNGVCWHVLKPITSGGIRQDEIPEWPRKQDLQFQCQFAPVHYLNEINRRAAFRLPQEPWAA